MKKRELIRYVRDEKGHPYAVILATGPEKGQIPWSICHTREQFCKETGKTICRARIFTGNGYWNGMNWLSDRSKAVQSALLETYPLVQKYFSHSHKSHEHLSERSV